MPLSAPKLKIARDIAQAVFEWEVLAEEHAAVLRQDPNQYAEVYEELERAMPPNANVLPPREQWDECIAQVAGTLEPKAVAFVEYVLCLSSLIVFEVQLAHQFNPECSRLKAMNACFLLCRLSMSKAGEDNGTFLEMLRIRNRLQYAKFTFLFLLTPLKFNVRCSQNHTYAKVEARFPAPADMHPLLAKRLGVEPPLPAPSSPAPSTSAPYSPGHTLS
ncbi:hypothetical protein B0H11DRAFT_2253470 [Mycena galericulata]|nr:hypothetical protein B0H11DRAFT_2253470 [Mycena galericulata]